MFKYIFLILTLCCCICATGCLPEQAKPAGSSWGGASVITDVDVIKVSGVATIQTTPYIIPDNTSKGLFLKHNSTGAQNPRDYGSLWCYDYTDPGYLGLEIDTKFIEFQREGTVVGQMLEGEGGAVSWDFELLTDVQTPDLNTQHALGQCQLGISGNGAASFGYRGFGVGNYALYQDSNFATYVKAGSGQSIGFFTNSTTLSATMTATEIQTINVQPKTDDTYYIGKNDDDSPFAYKGVILKDTSDGKYYRIEVINGTITATDLTD